MAQEFDLLVHTRNKKGAVTTSNPYRLEISQGVRRFERPPHSGIWYDGQGKLFPESEQKIREQEAAAIKAEQFKRSEEVRIAKEAEEIKLKAAGYDLLKDSNAKLLAKIQELEKRAK